MKTVRITLVVLFMMAFAGTGQSQTKSTETLPCIQGISNLSEDQQNQIVSLEKQHQSKMKEYRLERRSTTDTAVKNNIYEKMQQAKASHRNDVLNLLNEEQKKEYLALLGTGRGHYRNGAGSGCRAFRGQGQQIGRGKNRVGNCQGRFKGKAMPIGNRTNTGS